MIEAKYYGSINNDRVRCKLCPQHCLIPPGDYGMCRSRYNRDGVLYAVNYGRAVSLGVDPVEKKPLYHYRPNSNVLSLGCNTCNLACDFCQNYTISQQETNTIEVSPDKIIDICLKHHVKSVAFTYSEPLTWYEFILECTRLLKDNNIDVILVTNGYLNQEPLKEILPYIDAMNIDLKAMNNEFYKNIVQGQVHPVLEFIKAAYSQCHIEITNLLIPGENTDLKSINELVEFIAGLNKDIPLHFSKYFPAYKRTTPPTSTKTLSLARKEALKKLNYVYLGNVLTNSESNTYCPNCRTLLIERHAFNVMIRNLTKNQCSNCNTIIYGKFDL